METTAHDEVERKLFEYEVEQQLRRLRANTEARRRFELERAPTSEPFDAGTLDEILARPDEPPHRIAGLQPWAASVLLVAQRKTGKTTLTANWARSMLTGEDFLGRHAVKPLEGNLALLNYEVSGAQIARWLHDVGVPGNRCIVVNLRGRRNPLAHDVDRMNLATYLNSHDVEALAVDPFSGAFTGTNQNDAGEVRAWLNMLDTFTRSDVGATDLLLTTHAGWNGERTRGASALEDWPDAIWTLTRPDSATQGTTGPRYLRALGRDVDLDEDELHFDPITRQLTLTGAGSRRQAGQAARDDEARDAILELLEAAPAGLSGAALAKGAARKDAGFTRVRDALVTDGIISAAPRSGRGGGHIYRLNAPTCRTYREPTDSAPTEPTEPLSIEGGSGSADSEPNLPSAKTGGCAA